jgi:hypothetical protein
MPQRHWLGGVSDTIKRALVPKERTRGAPRILAPAIDLTMGNCFVHLAMKLACRPSLLALMLSTASPLLHAQPNPPATPTPAVPAWAQPGSATHVQVAPPADFHRPSRNFDTPIGVFEGQSDIGSALVPGDASYDAGTKQYTISSAGYNVWYTRDEFRYLWKKMSGDVSLAADIEFPDPNG